VGCTIEKADNAEVVTRYTVAPTRERLLAEILTKQIEKYESMYGFISIADNAIEEPKHNLVKIDAPFEDVVRALLKTPPSPPGDPPTRKQKPQKKKAAARQRKQSLNSMRRSYFDFNAVKEPPLPSMVKVPFVLVPVSSTIPEQAIVTSSDQAFVCQLIL